MNTTQKDLFTLQNVKDRYYTDLALNETERRGLDQYLADNYIQVYDAELNFIGYEPINGYEPTNGYEALSSNRQKKILCHLYKYIQYM